MRLSWHTYRYYPYERNLALRELTALLRPASISETNERVEISNYGNVDRAHDLTYFAGFANGRGFTPTVQARLEGGGLNRQSTRYSVHGLHEYKGKFNPQIAKAILNIFNVRPRQHVIDPFCGSGTTLVECAHLHVVGYGTDINPLAVYIANAKLRALTTPAEVLQRLIGELDTRLSRKRPAKSLNSDFRIEYLTSWFTPTLLQSIENLADVIREIAADNAQFFLAIASNLLREYSLQDPHDLRIRRRKSPLPDVPIVDSFLANCQHAVKRLSETQTVLGNDIPLGAASLRDVTTLTKAAVPHVYDAALTSPPYATALPYIDTQRLSLVWLNLLPPERILGLESELIGSRELRGTQRKDALAGMRENSAGLPESETEFCVRLQKAVGEKDGFRRRAVPVLLYRYFAAMQASFSSIRKVMKRSAPFGLIVGHNHTVLNAARFDVNTPAHLANIARTVGWRVEEVIDLQTYQRYGYHMNNAVAAESLILLRNS